jgi:hypothetical protein
MESVGGSCFPSSKTAGCVASCGAGATIGTAWSSGERARGSTPRDGSRFEGARTRPGGGADTGAATVPIELAGDARDGERRLGGSGDRSPGGGGGGGGCAPVHAFPPGSGAKTFGTGVDDADESDTWLAAAPPVSCDAGDGEAAVDEAATWLRGGGGGGCATGS